jgi:hypothetical protein
VAHPDPFDVAAPDCVAEGVQRVANQSEDLPDADVLERADQEIRHGLGHRQLLPLQNVEANQWDLAPRGSSGAQAI